MNNYFKMLAWKRKGGFWAYPSLINFCRIQPSPIYPASLPRSNLYLTYRSSEIYEEKLSSKCILVLLINETTRLPESLIENGKAPDLSPYPRLQHTQRYFVPKRVSCNCASTRYRNLITHTHLERIQSLAEWFSNSRFWNFSPWKRSSSIHSATATITAL